MLSTPKTPAAQAAGDAAGVAPGLNNAVLPCCAPARHLQIGIFFDGTGNYLRLDSQEAEKSLKWEAAHPGWKEEIQKLRAEAYEAACQAARHKKSAAAQAVRLRKEQAGLEEETRRASAAAERMAALQTALEMLGEEPREEHYQEHGAALDAWRTAKSRATAKAKECAAAERQATEAEAAYRQCLKEQRRIEEGVVPEVPGRSSPTNVARLSELYPDDIDGDQRRIYIKGVGTVDEASSQDDYTFLGKALGQARILEARERVLNILRKFRDCPPASVTIDIFGFSRGAALARHFVNVLQDGLPDYSQKAQIVTAAPPLFGALRYSFFPDPSTDQEGIPQAQYKVLPALPGVSIRFVGLFDTVGSFYWPGNADEGVFMLRLAPGCAGTVIHLVAKDERRKNFPATLIGAAGREATVAGVHADIGGGYRLMEKTILPMDQEVYGGYAENGRAEAEARLGRRAVAAGMCNEGPVPLPGYFFKHVLLNVEHGLRHSACYLMRAKITDGRYAAVSLNYMYKQAVEAGVPLDLGRAKNPEWYAVPEDLAQFVDSPPTSLPLDLWDKYLHVSAVDLKPVKPYALPALGYYTLDVVDQTAMKLDKNALQGRVLFPN